MGTRAAGCARVGGGRGRTGSLEEFCARLGSFLQAQKPKQLAPDFSRDGAAFARRGACTRRWRPREKGCFPRPAPPARRSVVTLASPRPARRGGSVQTSPRVAGGPRGSRSVAVSPRRAANSGRVGELSPELGGRGREP